jgi:hypothetical protein
VVAAVVAAGGRVHAVDPARRSLEDAFLDVVRAAGPPVDELAGGGVAAEPGSLR